MAQVTEKQIDDLVLENRARYEEIYGTYNPWTGENCYDMEHRELLELPDFMIKKMWVPKECMRTLLYRGLKQMGSLKEYIIQVWGREYNEKSYYTKQLIMVLTFEIMKVRFREDPEFALYATDKIEDKVTGNMIPFKLNYPQRKLLKIFEDLRTSGAAIRVVILKARQWGGSTLTQLYIKWLQDFRRDGWNAIVLAQQKNTAKKIKAMYRKALEHQPGWTLGHSGAKLQFSPYENSPDDFQVTDGMRAIRRSTLTVASFENFDSVRGSNFHCAHYSEVAYWKKTPEHDPEGVISSISGGIRNQEDNLEVFESTGKGNSGFFYEKCQLAMDPKNNDAYSFLFIPCFFIEHDMEEVKNERAFAKWLLQNSDKSTNPKGYRETGKFFWRMWEKGACFQAIEWYRNFRNKFTTHAFCATEAPVDEEDAFRNSGNLVFNPYSIDDLQKKYKREPLYTADIMVNTSVKDESTIAKSKIEIRTDGTGDLKIWAVPNVLQVENRYIVSVDIGGKSSTSDYTVMTVIDRFGMIPTIKGKPRVVARYRGHVRHDKLAWMAAALAHYYDDALLVIESNTADREKGNNTEGDHFLTILEEIADYYDNLYQRTSSSEDVGDNVLMKYGFQTNKLTKQQIIDNLEEFVDDMLWDEPDKEMYHELRIYERHDDGSLGNIVGNGNHDDVLMSTAIGLYVSLCDMEKPAWKKKVKESSGYDGVHSVAKI